MEGFIYIGNNSSEDVKWLCSLSESELNMLLGLQKLFLQRAENVKCKSLAKKIDLKMLRALGFILMKYIKGQLKETIEVDLLEKVLNGCNLLKWDQDCNDESTTIEDVIHLTKMEKEKHTSEGLSEVAPDSKRQKLFLNPQG